MSLLAHLWNLLCHHPASPCHMKPKVTDEQMAAITLYPAARRNVKKEPK